MTALPPFLVRLGLDANADEREIRRTYARLLKAIDRAADPAAFQSLHEAYESAKQWAAQQAKIAPATTVPAEPGPRSDDMPDVRATQPPAETTEALEPPRSPDEPAFSPPSPPSPPLHFVRPQPAQIDHDAISAEVFAEFAARLAQSANSGGDDIQALKIALEQTLNDPRLLNLQARTGFERRIGQLLVNGWQPGNHLLFEVAAEVFHWMEDSRRLDALGDIGPYLNRALMEYAIFLKISATGLRMRKRLIERLRDPRPPEQQEVDNNLNTLETMLARFPNWLRLVTNMQNIAMWRQGAHAIKAEIEENTRERKKVEQRNALIALPLLLGAVGLLVYFHNTKDDRQQQPLGFAIPQYRTQQAATPPQSAQPGERSYLNDSPPEAQFVPDAPKGTPLKYNSAQMREIIGRIQSNVRFPPPDQRVRNEPVGYIIEVTPEGNILKTVKTDSSPLPAFDDAILKAIYRSQPYPTSADHVSPSFFSITAFPLKK